MDSIKLMHSNGDNIEVIVNDNADEVIEELFQSPPSRYQSAFETLMKGSNFLFDCGSFILLFHKTNLN